MQLNQVLLSSLTCSWVTLSPVPLSSRREREVLELMARGLTNAAICQKLHLSVKTVEPLVSTVFAKLGLHADPTVNRRVLAALEYHRK